MDYRVEIRNDSTLLDGNFVHTWIVLYDNVGHTFTYSYGPAGGGLGLYGPGQVSKTETTHSYTEHTSISITENQFDGMKAFGDSAIASPPNYAWNATNTLAPDDFNCTGFSDLMLKAGGISVLGGAPGPVSAAKAINAYGDSHGGDGNDSDGGDGGYDGGAGSAGGGSASGSGDPLILDLDRDGVELVPLKDAHAQFDLTGNHFATNTAWVSADDGLLALDKNNNGKIDDVTELFGNATQTGFAALATHDSNADGRIDARDAIFSNLKVWRDSNGDGVSQAGELRSLGAYGITGINLANSVVNTGVSGAGVITNTGTFQYSNGTAGTVANVNLITDPVFSKYIGNVVIPADVQAMKNIKIIATKFQGDCLKIN